MFGTFQPRKSLSIPEPEPYDHLLAPLLPSPYINYRDQAVAAIWERGDYVAAVQHLREAFRQPEFRSRPIEEQRRELRAFVNVMRTDCGARARQLVKKQQDSGEMIAALASTEAQDATFRGLAARRHRDRMSMRARELAVAEMARIVHDICHRRNNSIPDNVFAEIEHEFEDAGL